MKNYSFFNFSSEKNCEIIGHDDQIRVIKFSANNKWMISGSWDNCIIIWKILDNQGNFSIIPHITLNKHSSSITSLKICPDSDLQYLISGSKDGTVKVWDPLITKTLFTLFHNNSKVFTVNIDNKCEFILSAGEDRNIYIWKITKDKDSKWKKIDNVRIVEGHQESVHVLKICSFKHIFASIGNENLIYMWKFPTGEFIGNLRGHQKIIYTIDFHPSLPILISGGKEKKIYIWNFEEKTIIKQISTNAPITMLKFNQDGSSFLSVDQKKKITFFSTQTGTIIQEHSVHKGTMLTVGISDDWSIIAVASRNIHSTTLQVRLQSKYSLAEVFTSKFKFINSVI